MNRFETGNNKLQIGVLGAALLLLLVLPPLTPHIYLWKLGRIPLSSMQMLYAVLSTELVVATYIWGVGFWSRFEPRGPATGGEGQQMGGAAQVPQPGTIPPVQKSLVAPGQPPVGPLQGGR